MKINKAYLLIFLILLVSPSLIYAHPGRTAADGCHYCRTNCDKWGVPWNERHCHNGGSVPAPVVQQEQAIYIPPTKYIPPPTRNPTSTPYPTATPKPTSTPVLSPTKKPISKSKLKRISTLQPTRLPTTQVNQTETPTPIQSKNIWSWFRNIFK